MSYNEPENYICRFHNSTSIVFLSPSVSVSLLSEVPREPRDEVPHLSDPHRLQNPNRHQFVHFREPRCQKYMPNFDMPFFY